MSKVQILYRDLGLISYGECLTLQQEKFNELNELKVRNRELPSEEHILKNGLLIFCEHPHVYTLGRSGSEQNLLADEAQLAQSETEFYRVNRGGDITYHGPGQLVGYPIFDLDHFISDIHVYMRTLEEAIILTLADYSLQGGRMKGFTGVWLDYENPAKARKICALGVHTGRWITMHGFALNVHPNLDYFSRIVPCGITDKGVTSMSKELGFVPEMTSIKDVLKGHLRKLFGFEWE